MNCIRVILITATLGIACGCSRNDIVIDGDDLTKEALMAAESSGYSPSWMKRDTLRICTWEDSFAPNVIASFEKALNVKITIDTFESNEELFEMLIAGECDYDIITPSSYIIPAMASKGLISKLNHLHLPNVRKNLETRMNPMLTDPLMTYDVPYLVTFTLLLYNRSQLPTGADPSDYAILGHPALKGRTAIFDDIRELLGIGLMHLGYSINSSNPDEINAAADQVIKWKRNAGRSDDTYYVDDISSNSLTIALCYSDQAFMAIVEANSGTNNTDIATALPKSGYSLAIDEFAILTSSKHKDIANAFINYIYETEVARSSMEGHMAFIPVKPAFDKISQELRERITLTPEQVSRGQIIMGFENRPKVEQLYKDAWERIKAAD